MPPVKDRFLSDCNDCHTPESGKTDHLPANSFSFAGQLFSSGFCGNLHLANGGGSTDNSNQSSPDLNTSSDMISAELIQQLKSLRQEHLLADLDDLPEDLLAAYSCQLEQLDLSLLPRLIAQARASREAGRNHLTSPVDAALPPRHRIKLDPDPEVVRRAREEGERLLYAGKVAALLVAGGQGTRLGHTLPKGMFPISPVMEKSLFQLLSEQVLARSRAAGRQIPYFIMTSEATHLLTVTFFQENNYFGLDPASVHFFQQGTMPAVDAETGKVLLAGIGRIASSPDGHGGVLTALKRAGHFDLMRQLGVEYLYYHQVDNPHAIVLGPEFLGHHSLNDADVSTKVVRKLTPEEKMGVMVEIDDVPQIIEYSDLPLEVASRRTADGELELWAGSTAMHVFSVPFLERFVAQGADLPYHIAFKTVPYWEGSGLVEPREPNAFKFEKFIFDVIPHSRKSLVVETSREREFNPVKNAIGINSPEHVRRTLSDQYRGWVQEITGPLPEDLLLEISPLFAVDEAEWTRRANSHPKPQHLRTGWYWG